MWRDVSRPGQNADIHVRAKDVGEVERMLKEHGIKYIIMIEDLEKIITSESQNINKNAFSSDYSYETYNRYDTVSGFRNL